MKQIEAFTLGKKFGHPELNEDSMVIMPDLGYAVIDGVTDRNGTRYGGMLSGRFASRTVKRALEQFLLGRNDPDQRHLTYEGPEWLMRYLTNAIRRGYEDNNALAAAKSDWKVRAGCTLMIAFYDGDFLQVVAAGDSGIRINGSDVVQPLKPLDDVTAILRREAWRVFEAKGVGVKDRDRMSGLFTWQGTQHQPPGSETGDPGLIETIEKQALEAARQHLPTVPDYELLELIQHGIAHGQGNFQNVTDRVLGYGGLDGFDIASQYIVTRRLPISEIDTIELFSDGYFEMGAEFGIASWEAAFQRVEEEDPHKIGRYMSVKGTTDIQLTDDRTYIGVRLR
ncbi:protein phosphatase 2C domain-containing protein [Rhizobium sp. XQZ8]|uniref:protein phosphatase 2C domain-containing protein n=1 Tax=Rhizobium populisoli TaxID=2859785 RepID=UPI001CA55188|nr:protein phosphatase 2C domain-containing protein [Rhizobium populisoli]MBW6424866.1 protein phosphatase 2C domain-containing protein [Rhizobium populisoli]